MHSVSCGRRTRRHFLADMGLGFTGLALNAMLADESRAVQAQRSPQQQRPDGSNGNVDFDPGSRSVLAAG